MKLKVKLAKEYADPLFINEFEGYLGNPEEAYLAGFEKAREMAAKKMKESWNNDKYIGRLIQEAVRMIGDDIATIGEEEVE